MRLKNIVEERLGRIERKIESIKKDMADISKKIKMLECGHENISIKPSYYYEKIVEYNKACDDCGKLFESYKCKAEAMREEVKILEEKLNTKKKEEGGNG